jgi:hypothetical protein
VNIIDPVGLYTIPYSHSNKQKYKDGVPIYAETNPLTNHITYFPEFNKLQPIQGESVD